MSSPLELLTSNELQELLSYLRKAQELPPGLLPPGLTNVPLKLAAALSHLTMANSMVSCYLDEPIYWINISAAHRS